MARKRNNGRRGKPSGRRIATSKQLMYKQIDEVRTRVVDYIFAWADTANTGYDLATVLAGTTDYTDMQGEYGLMKILSVHLEFIPLTIYTSLTTDCANGIFGWRLGVFDTTVTAKNIQGVAVLPNSVLINNKSRFSSSILVPQKDFISTSTTNTVVSPYPKVNWYLAYSTTATTNTGAGLVHLRVHMLCKTLIN